MMNGRFFLWHEEYEEHVVCVVLGVCVVFVVSTGSLSGSWDKNKLFDEFL